MNRNTKYIIIVCIALALLLAAVTAALLVGNHIAQNTASPGAANTDTSITEEQARRIALEHAGVSAENATMIRVSKDRDNGMLLYEIDFVSGDREYEYDIDATTGNIVSHSVESVFD